jgi:hypothetical protein
MRVPEVLKRVGNSLARCGADYFRRAITRRHLKRGSRRRRQRWRLGNKLPSVWLETRYAVGKSCGCTRRDRRSIVVNQSLHPHGIQHQIDPERRSCNCRWGVGVAGIRTVELHQQLPGRAITPEKKVAFTLPQAGIAFDPDARDAQLKYCRCCWCFIL